MRRLLLILGVFSFGVMLVSCSPKALTVEKPISPADRGKELTSPAKQDWEIKWDKTLTEARKEGKVVLYTSRKPGERIAVTEGFMGKTGIEVQMVIGRSEELIPKLTAERRAGLFLADIFWSGNTPFVVDLKPAGFLSSLEPALILPEVLDPKKWYKNTLPWLDKDHLAFQHKLSPSTSGDVIFMRGSIDKEKMKSWYDLLAPQFKGRMNMHDPTVPGRAGKWILDATHHFGLDWDYMKALAKQEPYISTNVRLMVDWVAKGKYLLNILPHSDIIKEYQEAGVPLEAPILKETADVLGGDTVGLIDRAPHPNAAKVFINWLLSKEGQTIYARVRGTQSAREDVPTDHLPSWQIRQPGVDYPMQTEEYVLKEREVRPKAKDIFGHLVR